MFFRILSIFGFILIIFIASPVFAVSANIDGQLTTDERLSNAVSEQNFSLDDATKQFLAQKCKPAQQSIVGLQESTDKLVGLRLQTYGTFQQELQAIKLRMARQGVDASEIDLLIGKLQQGLDKLTLAADSYGLTLSDVITVDCAQKPEQFKAGIVLLRAKRTNVLEASENLRNIMKQADQNTFQQLKQRLTA